MKLNQAGFTLIEILVVIGIIGVITGISADIFIQIVRGANKANIITEIKQNGDSTLNQIDRIIRNSEEVSKIGEKDYGGSWTWSGVGETTVFEADNVYSCPSNLASPKDVCALIVKNSTQLGGGYTRIEIHTEQDEECNTAPFTASDKLDVNGQVRCNGNIRIITDTTAVDADAMKSSTSVGQVITNTEKTSGVSIIMGTTPTVTPPPSGSEPRVPFFKIRPVADRPTVISIAYGLQQGIAASSRVDSLAKVQYSTTISLRNY